MTFETNPRGSETAALATYIAHPLNQLAELAAHGLRSDRERPTPFPDHLDRLMARLELLLELDVHRWARGAQDPITGAHLADPDEDYSAHPLLVLEVAGNRAANRIVHVLEAAGAGPLTSRTANEGEVLILLPLEPLPIDPQDLRVALADARAEARELRTDLEVATSHITDLEPEPVAGYDADGNPIHVPEGLVVEYATPEESTNFDATLGLTRKRVEAHDRGYLGQTVGPHPVTGLFYASCGIPPADGAEPCHWQQCNSVEHDCQEGWATDALAAIALDDHAAEDHALEGATR